MSDTEDRIQTDREQQENPLVESSPGDESGGDVGIVEHRLLPHHPRPRGLYAPLADHPGNWLTKDDADAICGRDTAGLFKKTNRPNQDRLANMFAAAGFRLEFDRQAPGEFVRLRVLPANSTPSPAPSGTPPRAHQPVWEVRPSSTADQIRGYLDGLFRQARGAGRRKLTVRAGDVHASLQLVNNMPNVNQVMIGRRLQQLSGVRVLSVRGNVPSSNVWVTYELRPAAAPPETGRNRTPRLWAEPEDTVPAHDPTSLGPDAGPDRPADGGCPRCRDAARQPEFRRCPYCGRELGRRCPECGRRLDPAWKLCPYH